jgi:hypothetical protein
VLAHATKKNEYRALEKIGGMVNVLIAIGCSGFTFADEYSFGIFQLIPFLLLIYFAFKTPVCKPQKTNHYGVS